MKLSEAILLGSTIVTPKAGALKFSGENAGCALGMAVIANGGTFCAATRQVPTNERRTLNVEDVWGRWLLRVVERPCDCRVPIILNHQCLQGISSYLRHPRSVALPREMRIKDIIAHLFDYHVMEHRDWTLDRLTTWLTPLEPTVPAEMAFMDQETANRPHDFSTQAAEAADWRKTCEAFETKVKTRHRRSSREARLRR